MGSTFNSAGANLATRVALHGGLSSFMSKAQGGRWSSGFWSGAVGTYLGHATSGVKGYYQNVAKNAIIGGTISRVTGGKFANGAALGAFRYMFNDFAHKYTNKYKDIIKTGNIDLAGNADKAKNMTSLEFVDHVKTGGLWDYKNQKNFRDAIANGLIDNDLMQRFGNFHFGMVANANGFNLVNSMYGAGAYQVMIQGGGDLTELIKSTGYYILSFGGTISSNVLIGGKTRQGFSWGDNVGDAKDIMNGWNYYEKNY